MKSVLNPARSIHPLDSVERMLGSYYAQFVEWSRILARGDEAAAEEAVQDLCLHLTDAQPDLSRVQNLDNYLFMCLRNMYVSNLARVSRERLRALQVEDFDAIGMAAANAGLDAVDVQNELIRIADFVLSRKWVSKSASHFILHFFLGYRRSDIAHLARLPISAVYNGLKEARAELRGYLSAGENIRLVRRGAAPESQLLHCAIPSELLFKELRVHILDGDPAQCVAERDLVDSYNGQPGTPVGCRELAHIAGCERCLNVLARMLELDDRDGPFDGVDDNPGGKQNQREAKSFEVTMERVRRRRERLLERRPGLLAIAVDGRVVAFHAVESTHNSLSSRMEARNADFIEVFNEYGDRMAHIPLDPESSGAWREQLTQQILLSDGRWLRLEIRFDGLGMQAEVDYVDRALTSSGTLIEDSVPRRVPTSFWRPFRTIELFRLSRWGATAFACLLLAGLAGVIGYRYTHPGWREVLAGAEAMAQNPLPTESLHQTLRIEQTVGHGKESVVGSTDIWRNSDGREVRRLFNEQQQLLATSIDSGDGTGNVRLENETAFTQRDRQLVDSGVWRSDVSAAAFANAAGTGAAVEASRNLGGYELTRRGNGHDGIWSRTLLLSAQYDVREERIRFQAAEGVREVRLVQTLLRRVPNRDVPPLTFPQQHKPAGPDGPTGRNLRPETGANRFGDSSSASLEVDVLLELFNLHADTGQPIEVTPMAHGRVHVAGTVADAHLLAAIRARIASLPNANQIDFQIYSASEAAKAVPHGKPLRQELTTGAIDAPATALLRDALLARGLKGDALQNAEQEFRASALTHAQTALQHAFALDRLAAIVRSNGEPSLNPAARIKWAEMVEWHSTGVVKEFQVLRLQLDSVSPGVAESFSIDVQGITDTASFARTSSDLRAKAESVNKEVLKLFAGSAVDIPASQARESIVRLGAMLPMTEANQMELFASRLGKRNTSVQNEMGEMHPH